MKKYFKFLICLILLFSLTGCSFNKAQYIRPSKKPSASFYTSEIYSKLQKKLPYTIKIFDMDVYKYYDVNTEEHSILKEFIECLNNESYGASLEENSRPRYKVIIEFSKDKYVINAYSNNLVSIYPWDGIYDQDIISLEGVPEYYNIYKFCEYIEKVSRGFEG